MKLYVAVLCLLLTFGRTFGLQTLQETCSHSQFQYRAGSTFLSVKADGRRYTCTCSSQNEDCQEINCRQLFGSTQAPPPTLLADDEISGSIPSSSQFPISRRPRPGRPIYLRPIFVPASSPQDNENQIQIVGAGTCFDEESSRNFQRGSSFIRISTKRIRMNCVCPFNGPATISCEVARCQMRETPIPSNPTYSSIGSCFDPWQNREYYSGSVYNRTRFMDVHNQMSGTYECECANSRIYCKAADIPCCNLETGEFVGLNETFITTLSGIIMECTCNRGRGRFSNCRRIRTGLEPDPLPLQSGYRPRCRDRVTRRRYRIGSTWYRTTNQEIVKCQCKRISVRKVQTLCSWVRQG